jgi:aryl-alcohol dehydrogenase-like predicted oxidoreductase
MSAAGELDAVAAGGATIEGTRRFARRFAKSRSPQFYRELADGRLVSILGCGTYLGECDDAEDARYCATIVAALQRGVNLLDTAINYRCQRSERAMGEALRIAFRKGYATRDQVLVCTKGGYIPLERTPPATKEGYRGFLQSEYHARGIMAPEEVVAGGHCLSPRYLTDQVERSRRNLGIDRIDVYYLHNPEQQLDTVPREKFLNTLRAAFAEMESHVRRGTIGTYGCSTWNGFRIHPGARNHLSLEELCTIARDIGGATHHFTIAQVPINLAMPEAVRDPTQCVGADRLPFLEAARRLGISVIGSASLMQSQLSRDLPEPVRSAFPGFTSDARRALAFVQSLPVSAALAGMKSVAHLEQNLEREASS